MADADEVRFTSRPSFADIMWTSARSARGSALSVAFGTVMVATAVLTFALGPSGLAFLPFGILGLAFLTGLFMVPITWIVSRRRPDLLAPFEVRADAEGLSLHSANASSRVAWSNYRGVRETDRAFLLDDGALTVILSKRGASDEQLNEFRSLVAAAGVADVTPPWRRRLRVLAWAVVGLAIASTMVFGSTALNRLLANARIELEVATSGALVTVRGSTDLPDGTLIAVDVYHADEWRRAGHGDRSRDVDSFPWIDGADATVMDGTFEATIDVTGWPAGRGGAVALFWVDGYQPPMVEERFGPDGADLRGPDVRLLDDGSRRLEVVTLFDLPSPPSR
jgi:hypothetical protein